VITIHILPIDIRIPVRIIEKTQRRIDIESKIAEKYKSNEGEDISELRDAFSEVWMLTFLFSPYKIIKE